MKEDKCERALQLHEKGLSPAQIAERIGSNPRNIGTMVKNALRKRELKKQLENAN